MQFLLYKMVKIYNQVVNKLLIKIYYRNFLVFMKYNLKNVDSAAVAIAYLFIYFRLFIFFF